MTQVTDHIPNLVGGITQQPPETRIKTAVDSMVNAYPSAVQGLSKRRGAAYVASMTSTALGSTSFMHTIDRDEFEKYFAITNSDGSVEVYDLNGTAQEVSQDARSTAYLTTTDPSKNIRAVTVGDYTFLTNRTVVPAITDPVIPVAAEQVQRSSHYLEYKVFEQGSPSFDAIDKAVTKVDSYEAFLEISVDHVNADTSEQTFTFNPFEALRDLGQDYEVFQARTGTQTTTGVALPLGRNAMSTQRVIAAVPSSGSSYEYTADLMMVVPDANVDGMWGSSRNTQHNGNQLRQYSPINTATATPVGEQTPSAGTAYTSIPTTNGVMSLVMAQVLRDTAIEDSYDDRIRSVQRGVDSEGKAFYWEIFAERLEGSTKTFTAADGTILTITISNVTVEKGGKFTFDTTIPCYISSAYEDFSTSTVVAKTDDTLATLADSRANPDLNQSLRVSSAAYSMRREIVIAHPRTLQDGTVETYYSTPGGTTYSGTTLATALAGLSVAGTDGDGVAFSLDLSGTTFNSATNRIDIVGDDVFYVDSYTEYATTTPYNELQTSSYAKRTVTDFEDLPDSGNVGEVVRVTGQSDDPEDDYYVEWDGKRWREAVAYGKQEDLDAETLPQALVRNADGTWIITPHSWRGREVGDEFSNETPSFVGNPIQDIFTFQGRLGFCAGESIVLSEVNYFEQFYRSTCIQLEDDNRIDVELRFGRVEKPHAALAVQDELILFSDKGQFSLNSNQQTLTPKTVSAKQIGDFETSTEVRPHTIGKSAFFTTELGGYTQAREFYLGAATDDRLLSSELTIQCPQFVTGNARYIQASRDHKAIFVLNRDDPTSLFVYKFEYDGQDKIQSAWCRWDLGIGDIESIGIFQNYLYCVSSLGSERELTRIDVRDQPDLLGSELMRLDMQVTPTKTYYPNGVDGNSDPETRLDLPFDGTDLVEVWDLSGGHTIPVDRYTSGGNLFVKGDHSGSSLIVGIPYTMDVKLSTIYRRAPKKPSGEIIVTDGRLTVNYLNIAYTDTATFQVDVSSRGRDTKTYYGGPKAGYSTVTFGDVPKSSGALRVPVMTRNENAEINIKNVSPFGCTILHVDWFGKHNPHARRV